MSTARITVCIPTYNRAHLLRQTLDSLCDQGLSRDEYVVAISDNCSTDQTPDVVAEYQDRLQLTYHRNTEDVGMKKNWHIALALCDTPYLVFHPDDDLVAPGQLGRALSALEAHEGAVLVCSPTMVQGYPGDPESSVQGMLLRASAQTSYSRPYIWGKAEWLALSLVSVPVSVLGAVFQHDVYRRCELWKSYQWWADRLLLAEMGLHGDVLSLPWVGGYYRVGMQQHKFRLPETDDRNFSQISELITKDILDICEREKIPVIEFWAEQIRLSPLRQRARYLHLLKKALPSTFYDSILRDSNMEVKTRLTMKLLTSNRTLDRQLGKLLSRKTLNE